MSRAEAKMFHPANYRNLTQIWGPDDFEQAVLDAQQIVEAGRRRRLRLVEEDNLPPAVLFTQSRHRRARLMDGFAVLLLLMLCAALGFIAFALAVPSAKADTEPTPAVLDYADRYGAGAICPVLDEHHTVSGMLGVLYAVEDDGFTPFEAGQIVGISVTEFCPRNQRLMQRFVDIYGGSQVA